MEKVKELKQSMGLLDSTMLVSGSMIGSGIFLVSADMTRMVNGSGWLLLLWLLTGIITLIGALCYGELAAMFPNAGGQFVYLNKAFGKRTGFSFGLITFLVVQTGVIAAVAIAFSKYSGILFPWFSDKNIILNLGFFKMTSQQLLAIALIWLLTFFNLRGIKNAKILQVVFTIAKLLSLLVLIVLGIAYGINSEAFFQNFENIFSSIHTEVNTDKSAVVSTSVLSGFELISVLGLAMVGSLFSCDAWNNITYTAGEITNPQRNLPLSLILGTGIVIVLYFLANLAYTFILPINGDINGSSDYAKGIMFASNDRVGSAALEIILPGIGSVIMAVLIIISTFGCNNGLILSGARLYYAMAKDKVFFKQAATLNKFNVPNFALTIQAIWASVLCLSGSYGTLLDYTIFSSLLFYIITIYGLIKLRKSEPKLTRPYKVPLYPILPYVYIVIASLICINLLIFKSNTSLIGVGIVVFAWLFHVLFLEKKNSDLV